MKTINKKNIFIFLGVTATLLIFFSFFDLSISMTIFNIESKFGIFFAAFGEWPYSIIAVFSTSALLVTRDKTIKWKNIMGIIVYGLIGLLFTAMVAMMPGRYISALPTALMWIIALGIYAASLFVCTKIAQTHSVNLRQAAVISIFTIVAATVSINIIKQFWGRPRMRIMTNPTNEFTPWFIPQGIAASDEYKSFPSGHSANSATIICITLLPMFVDRLKNNKTVLYIIAAAWTLTVMISRVIMGAHFSTDVIMGTAISVAGFYIVKHLTENYYHKKELASMRK